MTRKIKCLILPIFFLFSTCELFLGPDLDTSPSEVFKSLWNDFNNLHANLDIRMESNSKYDSWYDVYKDYAPQVSPDMSEYDLFNVCANMLDELKDPHVSIRGHNFFPNEKTYFSEPTSMLINGGNSKYKNFLYGKFSGNPAIGYIRIESFLNDEREEWGRKIDDIIDTLADTKALVLDVRDNYGGHGMIGEYIASRFASEHKDYLKSRTKTGPGKNDFSSTKIYSIKSISKASNNKYGYTNPIVLLTNRHTVSAAEWFTLMMKTQSHVTQIGTQTCGAFSSRNDRFMINGWSYSISPERVTDMDDKCYEGEGISPKNENIVENISNSDDLQLKFAINYLLVELAKLK